MKTAQLHAHQSLGRYEPLARLRPRIGKMSLAWATNLNLSDASRSTVKGFCDRIRHAGVDALLLGGDTAESWDLPEWLDFLDRNLGLPVYFVLGNQDYYGSDIHQVRSRAWDASTPGLIWLPAAGPIPLTDETALVGHGGWADGLGGRDIESQVAINDLILIRDLRVAGTPGGAANAPMDWLNRPALRSRLVFLGEDAAETLRPHLLEAIADFPRTLVLTHVPPFRNPAEDSGDAFGASGPALACNAIGDMLLEVAAEHPDRRIDIVCEPPSRMCEPPLTNLRYVSAAHNGTKPGFRLLTCD